jgi:phosphatidylserine/phosphatidylglycerophosphate/cardiolipin synthase-like enzyme
MLRSLFIALVLFTPSLALSSDITVYFSPKGGTTAAITKEVDSAKKAVLVQSYMLTSPEILSSLSKAAKRGVNVDVVTDKRGSYVYIDNLKATLKDGVKIRLDGSHAIHHNKIMIIDDSTLITGSFNFTKSAETRNAENTLIIRNEPALVKAYTANFHHHKEHSVVLTQSFVVPTPKKPALPVKPKLPVRPLRNRR